MNSEPQISLRNIKQSPKMGETFGVSDFLTKEEQDKLAQVNAQGKRGQKQFDEIDAYGAEIIARFGYEVYEKWNSAEIEREKVAKWVAAERARERSHWIPLESIVINMVGACVRRQKGESAPKGPKIAQKIVRGDLKAMRGEV